MTRDIVDSEQCAELLRCTPDQVEELARAGEIPGLKLGRGWIFVYADLLLFLAEKARADAQERRSKRHSNAPVQMAKHRRQPAPVFPTLPGASRSTGPTASEAPAIPMYEQRAPAGADRSLMDQKRLYVPAADAARMLSMGKSTFWREVKNKNVPAPVKIGSLTRWRVSDLQRLVEQAT